MTRRIPETWFCTRPAGAMKLGLQLGCPRRYGPCAAVLGDFRLQLSAPGMGATVSDRVGHDKTGVGYKDPSLTTNRSLALPSSSSTLPVDLQSTNTISLLVANVGFIDRSRRFSDFIAGNFSVVLLQEAHSCGILHRIAKARDMCILEGLGRVGSCMAVLAGQTGTKYLSRIYPTWDMD